MVVHQLSKLTYKLLTVLSIRRTKKREKLIFERKHNLKRNFNGGLLFQFLRVRGTER